METFEDKNDEELVETERADLEDALDHEVRVVDEIFDDEIVEVYSVLIFMFSGGF